MKNLPILFLAIALFTLSCEMDINSPFSPSIYIINYYGNGAETGTVPESQEKSEDSSITLAYNTGTLFLTGYAFSGWNTKPDGTGTNYAEGAVYTANTNLKLYAKWTKTYSIYYNGNGADGGSVPAAQVKLEGTDLNIASNTGELTLTGYTFTGWNSMADGSGTDYGEDALYTDNTDLTLYAQWKALTTYSITYEANGATGGSLPADQTKIEGIDLTLASNSGNLIQTGYIFLCWNTEADGSGIDYSEDSVYSDDSPLVLYAKWLPSYTITYNANGADGGSIPMAQEKIQGIIIILSENTGNLTMLGYTFAGWNTSSDGTGADYSEGSEYSIDTPITLYAKWTALPTYTVTYNANGAEAGTTPPNQVKIEDTNLALATNSGGLVRDGYSLTGWNTEADGTGTEYALGELYSQNSPLTLYAKWLPSYRVSYLSNGGDTGSIPSDQYKLLDEDLILSSNSGSLARIGYSFNCWNTSPNGNGTDFLEGAVYSENEALTLYAKWIPNQYHIIFDSNGGEGSMEDQVVEYGTNVLLDTVSYSVDGYRFLGWATSPEGEVTYSDESLFRIGLNDITLYAQWELIIMQVSSGFRHTLFIRPDGTLWSTGYNGTGQLGDGTSDDKVVPILIQENVESIFTGYWESMFIDSDNKLWAMGNNSYNHFGVSTPSQQVLNPIQISDDTISVATGSDHSLFLKNDGSLWTVGANHSGQLGRVTNGSYSPILEQIASEVMEISAGMMHSFYLLNDGSVWAMGKNNTGQLGNGTINNITIPEMIMSDAKSISTNTSFSLVLKEDGTVWGMGSCSAGRLGYQSTGVSLSPVQVNTDLVSGKITAVFAGGATSFFLTEEGDLWGLGGNDFGQLGNGTTTDSYVPVFIMNNVADISTYSTSVLIVQTDGTLWGLGENSYSQLGDGSTENRTEPIQIIF